MSYFAIQQKFANYCKSTILKKKKCFNFWQCVPNIPKDPLIMLQQDPRYFKIHRNV